jgi:uracil-DNA glycosylase family 4
MPGPFPVRLPAPLQQKIEDRLRFYDDLGITLFYRDRARVSVAGNAVGLDTALLMEEIVIEEMELPKSAPRDIAAAKPAVPRISAPTPLTPRAMEAPAVTQVQEMLVKPAAPLFEAVDKVRDDSLPKIRTDLGECTRCKLHKTRNKIVFGDGSPKAQLVFVGEGPGADEDMQGLPFVGRAGKLLTQMIEAMGLQRKDVYICNVVKCRPPQNRAPEPDEVEACSPFLLRQIDAIKPKVVVCLGAVAAKTLLNTTKGISQFRGEWLDWRGYNLMATYHPAYLLRNPPAKSEVWKDLQKVMAKLGLELPRKNKSS